MSIHKYYELQYDYNKLEDHEMSFKISGISFYQNNIKDVIIDDILKMELEHNNKYDKNAIKITYKNNIIGYVPNNDKHKTYCLSNLNENLIVIRKKSVLDNAGRNITGIRVIPETYLS